MGKGSRQPSPHPLLSTNQCHLHMDVPKEIPWSKIEELMSESVGSVRCESKTVTAEGRHKLKIRFENAYQAEMALAIHNGKTYLMKKPPIRWNVRLSHSSTLESAWPEEPICRQYVEGGLGTVTAQAAFSWFRQAGPLVTVRVDKGLVVEYWTEEDARYARRNFKTFSYKLRHIEALALRTFSPYSVICRGKRFGPSNVPNRFDQFGEIIHSQLVNQGVEGCQYYVSFSTRSAASAAIKGLNEEVFNGRRVLVSYFEPKAQDDFRLLEAGDLVRAPHQLTEKYHQNRLAEVRRECEAAERAQATAHQHKLAADKMEREAGQRLGQASTKREIARQSASKAKDAFLRTKRAFEEARDHLQQEEGQLASAQGQYDEAWNKRHAATTQRANADAAEDDCKVAKENAEWREEVLLNGIFDKEQARRGFEQNVEAERRKYEQLKAEKQAQREREQRAFQELKALEEELQNLEASATAASGSNLEEGRLSAYRIAVVREKARCKRRDLWCSANDWDEEQAIKRFLDVSAEFDDTKFGNSQPLTMQSVPWPTLSPPYDNAFDAIDWQTVETFFGAAKRTLGRDEYKTFVEKAHRRFHPDKWRSRGLLTIVLDERLRKRLEDAGNVVAQAITPLWRSSKL